MGLLEFAGQKGQPKAVVGYEHKRPGSLIHFDIKRLARIVKPGHRVHGDRTQGRRNPRGLGRRTPP